MERRRLERFCLTSLSRSRIIFTGDCTGEKNTACMKLLVEEFHRPDAPTEPPVRTSLDDPPPAVTPTSRVLSQEVDPKQYVIVAFISQRDFDSYFDQRRTELSNLASCAGVICGVAAVIAPDLAQNEAALLSLRSIEGVEVIDVNNDRNGNDQDVDVNSWVDAASAALWSFIARSRVACGSVTVHCWGASLTEGFMAIDETVVFRPYSSHLESTVLPNRAGGKAGRPSFAIPVCNHGVSGETSQEVRVRFERALQRGDMKTGDIVVILAGTNDLLQEREPRDALADVGAMCQAAQSAGISAVVCSLPSTTDAAENDSMKRCPEYNAGLKNVAESIVGAEFVDVYEFTSGRADDRGVRCLRTEIASDSIHLTVAGYKLLAEHVGEAVMKILSR